jgi:hypothetical protein
VGEYSTCRRHRCLRLRRRSLRSRRNAFAPPRSSCRCLGRTPTGPHLVEHAFTELLRADEEVWGVGIGVPGPLEFAAGRVVNPPIMTGGDRFDIAGWVGRRYPGQVIVEKDANSRAIAESRHSASDNLIALKLGTGVGAGRHRPQPSHLRRRAGPPALPLRQHWPHRGLCRRMGPTARPRRRRRPYRRRRRHRPPRPQRPNGCSPNVRDAGRVIGEAVATLVSVLNPATIVMSGQLAGCDEILLSGIRERIYERAQPLATRNLQLRRTQLGELGGVTGLTLITADRLLEADSIDLTMTNLARHPQHRVETRCAASFQVARAGLAGCGCRWKSCSGRLGIQRSRSADHSARC